MTSNYHEELQVLDQEHKPETVEWQDKVPEGTYQARLDTARVERSRIKQRLQTFFSWEVMTGNYSGRTIPDWMGMETSQNLDWLTRKIWNIYGEKISFKWSEVEEKLYLSLLDTICEIRIKQDKETGIQNVFVNKKILNMEELNKPQKQSEKNGKKVEEVDF